MKKLTCIKTTVASLLLAGAAVGWALPPTLLYSAPNTSAYFNGTIGIATTVPPPHGRAAYVVAAEANTSNDLEVIAFQDTHDAATGLVPAGTPGVVDGPGLFSVAITGLDSSRVVTADIDYSGTLSINTWTVGTGGVVKQNGRSTGVNFAYQNVAITTLSPTEVVIAYQQLDASGGGGSLAVEAWTIGADGLPTAEQLIGSGPPVVGVSIATVNPNQVVTAANDDNHTLWVYTWGVDSAGVHYQDHVEQTNTVDRSAVALGIGAGTAFRFGSLFGHALFPPELVQVAFTPIIYEGSVEVIDWRISTAGVLTQTNTPVSSASAINYEIAGCMLPGGIRMTAYGNDDGELNVGLYGSGAPYVDSVTPDYPLDGITSIAATLAGSDYNVLRPYSQYNAYFITAELTYTPSHPDSDTDVATLQIQEWSYPVEPL